MLSQIAEYRIKKLVSLKKSTSGKNFMNWSQIHSIALIIDETEKNSKRELDSFLEKLNKHVEVFFLELHAKNKSFGDWNCFLKSDKTMLGLPKKTRLQSLKSRRFDVILQITSTKSTLFSIALSASFDSNFTVGPTGDFNHNDLIIKRGKEIKIVPYLEDIIHYLEMIKS